MDIFKNKYLFIPLLVLLFVFALDKIAFIPEVKNSIMYWKKIEPLLYESRESLFSQLQKGYATQKKQNKKLGLILGTSRSSEFDTHLIGKYIPDSYTYNFSAPFSSVAWYYYWLDRVLSKGVKPAFVVLELDAAVFTAHALDYQLSYSFDMLFVLLHTDINRPRLRDPWKQNGRGFSILEADKYFLKQLFGFYKYPIKTGNIKQNLKKQLMPMPRGGFKEIRLGQWRKHAMPIIDMVNKQKLGGIPNFFFAQLPPDKMKKDIVNMAGRDWANFRAAPTQVVFLKKILTRLADEKIPVLVYVPYLNPELYVYLKRSKKNNVNIYDVKDSFSIPFQNLIGKMRTNKKALIHVVNLNQNNAMVCKKFTDSYHLSGKCFPELTKHLFEKFAKTIYSKIN